ncbi:HAD family hydrolase [Criblamydia sequanensis]|uniref:HAD-superfamily hydrolase n=1 Tax=Candidatus Criblamydia sequanensis CRIB-18 TaxID=1437425 RepID=A0A090CZ80_9BACT|nr:HAD family phosphatase [Criblamydia sequanensis]CDR34091.1 HAD-superfamily hydrolase [Criblamydia sequanensis CRIB-18]
MGTSNLKAFLLDFDGTVANSLPLLYDAYDSFLKKRKLRPSLDEFNELKGPSLKEILLILKNKYSMEETLENLYLEYETDLIERYKELKPHEGALEFLQALKKKGLKLALVSSAPNKILDSFLSSHPDFALFDLVVSGESVKKSKPNPDIYINTLRLMNLNPSETIAIEDSLLGALSADKADIQVWLIFLEKASISLSRPPLFFNRWKEALLFFQENYG